MFLSLRTLLLYALQVAAVASVHLNEVAFVNEEGHADLNASLESGRLESVGCCVALDARLRVTRRLVLTGISPKSTVSVEASETTSMMSLSFMKSTPVMRLPAIGIWSYVSWFMKI